MLAGLLFAALWVGLFYVLPAIIDDAHHRKAQHRMMRGLPPHQTMREWLDEQAARDRHC